MKKQTKIKAKINKAPYSIPIEMRPLWRICLIVLSIAIVSGHKGFLDIKKVNILVWMLIRYARWDIYEDYLYNRTEKIPLVSVDTATYRAIEFSVAKGFVTLDRTRLHIADAGRNLFDLLVSQRIMEDEREFLLTAGKKLTDKKVKSLTGNF